MSRGEDGRVGGQPRRIVLLGAPGAGKSTQARFLCERFAIPQISTGEMLRAAMRERTPLGLRVENDMKSGNLIDDSIVIELARERLRDDDCRHGFLFDGFPRTRVQAETMRTVGIALDHVLEIDVPDAEIVRRMSGRRVHPASGRSYHIEFNPPRRDGLDDVSGEPLVRREDDAPETVLRRLAVFARESRPLGAFYATLAASSAAAPRFSRINGVGGVEAVRSLVFSALGEVA